MIVMMMRRMRMKQHTATAKTETLDPRPAAVSRADIPDTFWFLTSAVKVHLKSLITLFKSETHFTI